MEQNEATLGKSPEFKTLCEDLLSALELGVTRVIKYGQQNVVNKWLGRRAAHKSLDSIKQDLESVAVNIEEVLDSMDDRSLAKSFRRTFSRQLSIRGPEASTNSSTTPYSLEDVSTRLPSLLSGSVSRKHRDMKVMPKIEGEWDGEEEKGESTGGAADVSNNVVSSLVSSKASYSSESAGQLTERKRINRGMNFKVQCMAYSEDLQKLWWCTRLVENNLGNAICVYDIIAGKRATLQASVGCSTVECFHFDEHGGLWTGHSDGDLQLWDAGNGSLMLKTKASSSSLTCIITNLVRSEVWAGSMKGNIRVFRFGTAEGSGGTGGLHTWKRLSDPKVSRPHPSGLRCMLKTRGGKISRVWSAGGEDHSGGIKIWELDTFQILHHLDANSPRGEVRGMVEVERQIVEGERMFRDSEELSSMPEIVVTAHMNGQVVLWDVEAFTILHVLGLKGSPAKALSVRNGLISTGHKDGWMHLWKLKSDLTSIEEKPLCAAAHRSCVLCILHIGDGLMTSTQFGTIRFWPLDDLEEGFTKHKQGLLRQGTLYLRSTSTICLDHEKLQQRWKKEDIDLIVEGELELNLVPSVEVEPEEMSLETIPESIPEVSDGLKGNVQQEAEGPSTSLASFPLDSDPVITEAPATDSKAPISPKPYSEDAISSNDLTENEALSEAVAAVLASTAAPRSFPGKPERSSSLTPPVDPATYSEGMCRPDTTTAKKSKGRPAPPGRFISERLSPLTAQMFESDADKTQSSYGPRPGRSESDNQLSKLVSGGLSEGSGSLSNTIELDWSEIQLLKMIGQGSFGQVFKGSWRSNEVAVKILSLSENSKEKELAVFKKEVDLLASVRCPNVVMFMGACSRPPQLCMVMEFCGRGSLFELLESHRVQEPSGSRPKQLLWTRRLQIALDIALGMNYLHTCSPPIIHRDLKSPNIMISANWQAKVGDLGMSRIMEYSLISGTVSMYSPRWMAPEVLKGQDYGTSSDIYSFAVILWELATLQVPWEDSVHPYQMVHQITEENRRPTLPSSSYPLFEGLRDLNRLIEDCWATDPAKRPISSEVVLRVRKLIEEAWKCSVAKRKTKAETQSV